MTADLQNGIGEAWLGLAAELQQALRQDDPEAHVEANLSPSGLLALKVRTIPGRRTSAVALARRYEGRAASMCERCGSRVTRAGAGPVVTMLCVDCSAG